MAAKLHSTSDIREPLMADQAASELGALIAILRQLAETARDDEWCALRAHIVTLTYVMQDMTGSALSALQPARASVQ